VPQPVTGSSPCSGVGVGAGLGDSLSLGLGLGLALTEVLGVTLGVTDGVTLGVTVTVIVGVGVGPVAGQVWDRLNHKTCVSPVTVLTSADALRSTAPGAVPAKACLALGGPKLVIT